MISLAARLVAAKLRGRDPAEALAEGLRALGRASGSPNFVIRLAGRTILFISDPALSRHVLAAAPCEQTFMAGTMKRKAMSLFAPHALTILHGQDWRCFRAFNEEVLQPGGPHDHLPLILNRVEKAFERPLTDLADIRRRMGEVMLDTVFGDGRATAGLADNVDELFAEVGLRGALLGSRKRAKRERFRTELSRLWRQGESPASSLLALAHRALDRLPADRRSDDIILDQIPHWMFTFTNSGADLLARSLAVIAARADVLDRVQREIAAAEPLDAPAAFDALTYLNACVTETGRLFPPVVLTAHRAALDQCCGGIDIEAGTEILQYFPLGNRDASADPDANHFRPERWLDPSDPVHARPLNTFLSGARACPGQDLIRFVVKSAIASQLRHSYLQSTHASPLGTDPLPFSFPKAALMFRPGSGWKTGRQATASTHAPNGSIRKFFETL